MSDDKDNAQSILAEFLRGEIPMSWISGFELSEACGKGQQDAFEFGSGFMTIHPDGRVESVPHDAVFNPLEAK